MTPTRGCVGRLERQHGDGCPSIARMRGILRAPPLPPTLSRGRCPLGVDMTFRGVDMTLQVKILEDQNWGPWGFSGPGSFKKRFPGKNDVEWYPQK